ncbi:hypothetical protein H5410_027892, partial [Solanum commersonii]
NLSTFVELELAFEASTVNLRVFDNGIWIEERSMDTNEQKGTRQLKERRTEGENQVGDRKEQLASRRTVLQCSARSPKVTELEDVEGKSKNAIELTKGRIIEWIGDPDLLRRMFLKFKNSKFGDNIFLSFENFHFREIGSACKCSSNFMFLACSRESFKTKITDLMLKRVNGLKRRLLLIAAYWCSLETNLIRGKLFERKFIPTKV